MATFLIGPPNLSENSAMSEILIMFKVESSKTKKCSDNPVYNIWESYIVLVHFPFITSKTDLISSIGNFTY